MSRNKKMYFVLIIAATYFVNQITGDVVKGILLGSLIASKYENKQNFIPMPYYEGESDHLLDVFNHISQSHPTNRNHYSTTTPPSTTTTTTTSTTASPTTTTTPTTSTSTTSTTSSYEFAKDLMMVVLIPKNIRKDELYESNDFESWLLNEFESEELNHDESHEHSDDNGVLELDLSEAKPLDEYYYNKH